MAVMQWISAFFSMNWLDALAVIFGVMALGAGMVFLWQRMTGTAMPSEPHAEGADTSQFRHSRVA